MSKTVTLEIEVKEFGIDELFGGDLFEYNDEVYKFDGYEWGTYPIGTNIKTGEQITLPNY